MAGIARVIAPGYHHHITQRGNRRQQTFFCDKDYKMYINLMSEWCKQCKVEVWAYCLMPNHVHINFSSGIHEEEIEELRKHEQTGRPLGSERFVKKLERTLDRILHKQKPGRKKRDE
jgi:hypothetical protein